LKKYNLLGSELIAAHIHDTTENERKILIENNVSMVGCPSSISKIDGIIPPIANFLHLGGNVSIGTDEAPGTGHHNLFNELRLASLLSKVNQKDPTVLPPWEAFNLVTIGAANILGLDNKIGALEVGKRADIITIDLNHLNLLPIIDFPFQNLLTNIVYSIKGNEVDNVIIAGKQIIQDNKFLDINIETVLKQVKKRSKEIFEDASEDWKKSESQMVEYHRKGFI
jgi:5-methylthioadenosine/S-adenosylhomocysteine deaminase